MPSWRKIGELLLFKVPHYTYFQILELSAWFPVKLPHTVIYKENSTRKPSVQLPAKLPAALSVQHIPLSSPVGNNLRLRPTPVWFSVVFIIMSVVYFVQLLHSR